MITLKTLPQATEQEVFDQVARHLLTQGKKSMTTRGGSKYHTGKLSCAAGCLIADDEYSEEIEGNDWDSLAKAGKVPTTHKKLIWDLQEIHDYCSVPSWNEKLKKLALKNNLSYESSFNETFLGNFK